MQPALIFDPEREIERTIQILTTFAESVKAKDVLAVKL